MIEPSRLRENILTSCGLGWLKTGVDWKKGLMLGQHGSATHLKIVNFWAQSGIYVLYRGKRPYYVGIAPGSKASPPKGLGIRIRDHLDDQLEPWEGFSWFGTRDITAGTDVDGRASLGPTRKSNDSAIKVWRTLHDMEALLYRVLRPAGNDLIPYFGERRDKKVQEWSQVPSAEHKHYSKLARGPAARD